MKKKILSFLFIVLLLITQVTSTGISSDKHQQKPFEWNTPEELVARMTLAEKVGQMTQAERGNLHKGDVEKYFLGSVLSGGGSTPSDNSPQGWLKMVNGFTEESLKTRLKIPVIYGIDAVHGHNNAQGATILPHNIALGAIAAGNPVKGAQAAYTAGRITAQEMIATGIRWTFAPVLGVAQDPRWGRTYESYSENADIVSAMGEYFIKGVQENGGAACMKHFLGEGQTVDGRNQGNALLDQEGIEKILPPYRAAIKEGALSLMPSFSSVNGIKMHQNKELLTDLLKGEMGYKGFVVSDWSAVKQLTGGSYRMQIANAINAGVDMCMAADGRENWMNFISNLTKLVGDGIVPMSRIDDAVVRILRFKQKLKLFESPLITNAGEIGTDENRAAARELVSDSLVLLRNEKDTIRRLSESKRILVTGQAANNIGMQCGGWTITWQGGNGTITKGTSILEGIKEVTKGKADISYSEDGNSNGKHDAVIAVIGEDPYAETQGDRSGNISIRPKDIEMLKKAYTHHCPVTVIMLSGRPMNIGDELRKWDAFIAAWLPGTEGAGIADVLFGGKSFVGRSPYTWRRTQKGEVLFPFGAGL
jgi:beta-glucosidase